MKCPNCNTELVPGDVFFKKSLTNFAIFGFGSKDLIMTTNQGDDISLLEASERASAMFCEECGIAVIATEKGRVSALKKNETGA